MDLLEKLQRLKEESKKETIPEIKKTIDKSKRQKKLKMQNDNAALISTRTSKKIVEKTISKEFNLNLELEELAKTSEFQRLIYKALLGKVHRGSKEDLINKLGITLKQLRKLNK